jgi:hypothetical protein
VEEPRPAAARLARLGPLRVVLVTLGAAVLDPEDVGVQALVDQVASADPATYDAWAARIRAVVESLVRTKTEVA